MKKIVEFICKNKIAILIISILLLIPTVIGIVNTKINYDILVYLPDDIETMKGQKILKDDFDMGAFTIISIDNTNQKKILDIEDKIRDIDGVSIVGSIDDILGVSIPMEILPSNIKDKVVDGNDTLMMVTFKDTTSSDDTLNAVEEIRTLLNGYAKIGGMSGVVLDTMELSDSEITLYVVIAVILCVIVLTLLLDSYVVPYFLLLNIGFAILYNMGTNVFFNNISYITKAISAVLQLGVTTDFSIFLYHKYESNKKTEKIKEVAMSSAIKETFVSVFGSSFTTIAGFLALCTMNLTLGKDIGIVMAKGVLFGLICVLTILPALLLTFDKIIERTKHKSFIPSFKHIKNFAIKKYKYIFVAFLLLLMPAYIGNSNSKIYYNLDRSLPDTLDSVIANTELKEKFNIISPEIILIDKNLKNNSLNELTDKLKNMKGIDLVLNYNELSYLGIPDEILDGDVSKVFQNDKYQMIFINSTYEIASKELNTQIDEINKLVKSYDKKSIIAGEGPLTNDLIEISDKDFKNVNYTSIAVIFVIMLLVLKSVSLPIILVSAIEFAIFINVAISYYTGVTIPFVSSIVIGTIQLGATIDYAILMTTKYIEERKSGLDKFKAMKETLDSSVNSIFVSGMCFFCATFGVSIISDLELISSICTLISRGAIISMLLVILVLPSLLLIFDSIICKTTTSLRKKEVKMKKVKIGCILLASLLLFNPLNIDALSKEETVYSNLNSNGEVNTTVVSEHLINEKTGKVNDRTNLTNIINLNSDETYSLSNSNLIWNAKGQDIFYKGSIEKNLPVSINIKYYLDNKEMKSSDMVGKSGNVKIVINYKNNSKKSVKVNGSKTTLYTPFVVSMLTNIETKNASNVKATNANIIDNGKFYSVVGFAAPGLYESLDISSLKDFDTITITYKTTSYKFNSIYNIAAPKLIDSEDLDLSKLNSIYSKVKTLNSASSSLKEGTKELLAGLKEYSTKFNEFNNGMSKLSEGTNTLNQYYLQLNSGIQTINEGTSNLKLYCSSFDTLSTNVNALYQATNQIASNSSNINALVSSTNTTLLTHIQTLQTIMATTTDEATKTAIQAEIVNLSSSLNMTELSNLSTNVGTLNQSLNVLNNKTKVLADTSKGISTKINVLAESMNTVATNSATINGKISELNTSVSTLAGYSNSFNENNTKIVKSVNTLNNGMIIFDKTGIKKINSLVNNELKTTSKKLEKLVELGEDYQTFTMKEKNSKSSTKFIMIVNE